MEETFKEHQFLDDRDQVIRDEDEDMQSYEEERKNDEIESHLYPSEGLDY